MLRKVELLKQLSEPAGEPRDGEISAEIPAAARQSEQKCETRRVDVLQSRTVDDDPGCPFLVLEGRFEHLANGLAGGRHELARDPDDQHLQARFEDGLALDLKRVGGAIAHSMPKR